MSTQHATTTPSLHRRWANIGFLLFALAMGLYGVLAIETAPVNFAAIHDPAVLEGRLAARAETLAGDTNGIDARHVADGGWYFWLFSKTTSPEVVYGGAGIWDSVIHYAQMPKKVITTLSLHNLLGGLCMLFGGLQFLPAFRQRFPRWHRGFGMVYLVAAQLAMLAAMAFMLMTPLEKMYDTLTFTVGLWFLAIGVTVSLWMSIWHLKHKEYGQHQAWMALSYSMLLTAPFTRINWIWAAWVSPEASQLISNYLATAVLIPGCILIGYAILCMNRWQQKERSSAKPGLSSGAQRLLQPATSGLLMLASAGAVATLIWFGLLNPGLANSELTQALLPASVIAQDSLLQPGLTPSRLLFSLATIGALLGGMRFIWLTFLAPTNQRSPRPWAWALMALSLTASAVQIFWGWQYGVPNADTFAGGASYMFNGIVTGSFALLMGYALLRNDTALTREWAIFTLFCNLAVPTFYWMLGILSLFPIPAVYLDGGHAYRLGMYGGLFLLTFAFIYSAYGEATQRRFAR